MGREDGPALVEFHGHGLSYHIDRMHSDINLGAFFNDRTLSMLGAIILVPRGVLVSGG